MAKSVQRRAAPEADSKKKKKGAGKKGRAGPGNAARAEELAEKGTQGGGTRFPFLEQIQASFGPHDVTDARAHIDQDAKEATAGLGAMAVAHGDDVAFDGPPDLFTAAHEAAHVVQQGSGGGPASGLGQEGDRDEQVADQVAERVVAGESAAPLLDQVAQESGSASEAVQLRSLPEKEVSSQAMGRLKQAADAIEETDKVMAFGAGNQLEALQATNFNSYFRMAAMRDNDCWELHPSVISLARQYPEALTAAKADLAQGGNCGEYAMVAFDILRQRASGDVVNRCDSEGLDHAYVILGDIAQEADHELVVADAWPTAPTACLWEDFFGYRSDRGDLNTRNTASGDDRDVKAAIAAGLRLSAKGEAMLQHGFDEEKTKEEIKSGREGENPWIWAHSNTAAQGSEYEYFSEPTEAEIAQAASEETPEAHASESESQSEEERHAEEEQRERSAESSGEDQSSGWSRFMSWLRAFV